MSSHPIRESAEPAAPVVSTAATTSATTGKLPLATIAFYGLPALVLGFSNSLVLIYILKFATDVMLIAPGLFATVFALARIWDAISDPIAGYLSDRTTSKHGRRRPWIAIGALPLAASVIFLWSPPASLSETGAVIWISLAIVFFYTAYTMVAVPQLALGAEMTSDYHERSKVFGGRGIFDFVGVLLAAFAIWFLQTADNPREAARLIAWVFAGLSIPILWFSVSKIVERPEYLGRGAEAPIAAFRDILRNQHARILLAVFFLENLGMGFIAILTPFIIEYILPEYAISSGPVMAVALVITLISFPIWFPLSRRFGKRNAWIASSVMKVLGFGSIAFMAPGREWIGLVSIVLIGASLSAHIILAASVKADVIDYDEYVTGERKEGAYFAIWNLVLKFGGAVAVLGGGIILEISGYEANVKQTPDAVFMMRSLYGGVPVVLYGLVIVLLSRFRLNQKEHAEIRAEIDRRDGGARASS